MRQLKENVYLVGAIDWSRRLFDELVPLPDGTSYNSYLIKGSEKTVLIDSVDPEKTNQLINNIIATGAEKIDYVVSNHCEQDHSGSIGDILLLYPDCKVVTNQKCMDFLINHLHLEEDKFQVIEDNEELSLGDKTLRFVFTPWVHWPETMSTYLIEDKMLFSCDFFGSHMATSKLYASCDTYQLEEARRYYAEIMMPFRNSIKKNLDRVDELEIEYICPSHGPIWDKPSYVIDAYKEWVSDKMENLVLVPYVSMHNSTNLMVDHFVDALIKEGVDVFPFNVVTGDIGKFASKLVNAASIILASPQVLAGPHPSMGYAALIANALRPKAKFAGIIGSFGWGGKMIDILTTTMSNLKVEMFEPVMVKGQPRDDDFIKLDELAALIASRHKDEGLM